MKPALFLLAAGLAAAQSADERTAREILALERAAMDGWAKGDPARLLAMTDPNVTYFHAMTAGRLEGAAALKQLFARYQGRPLFEMYEIRLPKIQTAGETAILTYILVRRNGGVSDEWNATQVYQRKAEGWRVIHSHFSQTRPTAP